MRNDRQTVILNHSLAVYPKEFKGCVVSPNKICMQFVDGQSLLRVTRENAKELKMCRDPKFGYEATVYSTAYSQFNTVSIGADIATHRQLWDNLLVAYQTYIKEYDYTFKNDLISLKNKLETLLGDL